MTNSTAWSSPASTSTPYPTNNPPIVPGGSRTLYTKHTRYTSHKLYNGVKYLNDAATWSNPASTSTSWT